MDQIFKEVENNVNANLTKYIIYGTHLNLEGEIQDNLSEVKSANLILMGISGREQKIPLQFEESRGKLIFTTSKLINTGINLEKIEIDKYYLVIEVQYGNKKKTYSIQNQTRYEDATYYTMTKNHTNHKIEIQFDTYQTEAKRLAYMQIQVKKEKLPKDVYDIVIDPGHGGSDNGAEYKGYAEANITLEYSKKLKKELEKLGLKVKMTRDGTEEKENFGVKTVYDREGRVNVVGRSKAKYILSIHLNSIDEPNSENGVEIYVPPHTDLRLARMFAKNIVQYANTKYSTLEATYRKEDGIYARTFQDWEIEKSKQEARENGYQPYHITENTPYLYMLRETGGIATGAYIDGRNTEYGKNMYFDSQIGVEAYLLELGYINHDKELKKLLYEQEGYIMGITQTIKSLMEQ